MHRNSSIKVNVVSIFLLIFSISLFGQSDKNCKRYKSEMKSLKWKIDNAKLPNKKLESIEKWLTAYEKWEICSEWELDIDLADQEATYKEKKKTIGQNTCLYCEKEISSQLAKMTANKIISTLKECGCDNSHPLIVKAEYDNAVNGTIENCNKFIDMYPSSEYVSKVRTERDKKIEYNSYQAASEGGRQECNAYLNKHPNGDYAVTIRAKINRYNKQSTNSNTSLWSMGDRICTEEASDGTIQAVIEQWNENKTKLKVKILAGYQGMYKGEDLFKGNLIWISPDDWYKCIGDEDLNYDIPTYGNGGIVDRAKYKFSVGSKVSCRQWGNGNSGYDGVVLDKKDSKYLIKVTNVIVSGFFSSNLSPSDCSGHVRLMYSKERYDDEGEGSRIWVDKNCVE